MKNKANPFKLKGYYGPRLFCNREEETKNLIENAKNEVNTTLLSIRRMGKTGLIHHVFNILEKDKHWKGVYVDIYATQNMEEFTNQLATAIFNVFPQKQSIGKKFILLLKGFNPVISYDALTGKPEISLSFSTPQQNQRTLKGLFDFLEQQKQQVLVAIDEFQQIANYPEKNMEAVLRTIIQPLKKTTFIFSGSHKHLLHEIFNSANRPFFSSTQPLHLKQIDKEQYAGFITRLFKLRNKKIDKGAVAFILDWTKAHTYYTQALCNKTFSLSEAHITIDDVLIACDAILKEQENIFFQYRNLLTLAQWKLLRAIAKEDTVTQPTGAAFVSQYQLGNPASVRRSLQALVNKEMVVQEMDDTRTIFYQVYDCFLSRWLAR